MSYNVKILNVKGKVVPDKKKKLCENYDSSITLE